MRFSAAERGNLNLKASGKQGLFQHLRRLKTQLDHILIIILLYFSWLSLTQTYVLESERVLREKIFCLNIIFVYLGWERDGTGQSGVFFCSGPACPAEKPVKFCPEMSGFVVQRDFNTGTVLWLWVPVPVQIPEICGTGTDIPTLSRDKRPSLVYSNSPSANFPVKIFYSRVSCDILCIKYVSLWRIFCFGFFGNLSRLFKKSEKLIEL